MSHTLSPHSSACVECGSRSLSPLLSRDPTCSGTSLLTRPLSISFYSLGPFHWPNSHVSLIVGTSYIYTSAPLSFSLVTLFVLLLHMFLSIVLIYSGLDYNVFSHTVTTEVCPVYLILTVLTSSHITCSLSSFYRYKHTESYSHLL